jgi:hypothetical protein
MAFMSFDLLAHPGGHGPPPKIATCKAPTACTKNELIEASAKMIPQFADTGMIDKSWKTISQPAAAEQKDMGKFKIWKIQFTNPKEPNKDKQNIFMFVTIDGTMAGANFDGK